MSAVIVPDDVMAQLRALAKTSGSGRKEIARLVQGLPLDVRTDLAAEYLALTMSEIRKAERLRREKAAERAAERAAAAKREKWLSSPEYAAQKEQFERECREAEQALRSKLFSDLSGYVETFRQSVIVEYTAELLATHFGLPDGRRVTWGEATVAEHQARAEMFRRNSIENLAGCLRHEQAIKDLEVADCANLIELLALRGAA